ncbi:uncharacterized protein [Oscarella lobularis]|uniref:uncharacterized protein n=1 Tax=Oscarella lobularis TaxID=121494 RepID=UPI0033138C6D
MRFRTVLLLVLAECLAETHVYPEFPQNFTLSLETNIYGAPKTSRIYVSRWKDDTGKESFSIFLNETESLIGNHTYLIMTNPPGVLPGSLPARNRLVHIQLGNDCQYSGIVDRLDDLPIGLASFLGKYDFDDTCIGMQICSNMTYIRTTMQNTTKVNVWNRVIGNSQPYGPDNLTVFSDASTGIPIHGERYHPGRSGTFDPPEYITTDIYDVIVGNPSIDFDLLVPHDWMRRCKNLDKSWDYNPDRSFYYVTPDGNDSIAFNLVDPSAWGSVTMRLFRGKLDQYNCTDCFDVVPSVLVFTQENYTEPQKVDFVYRKEGCGDVGFAFEGSGWDGDERRDVYFVCSCKRGVPGKSCPQA